MSFNHTALYSGTNATPINTYLQFYTSTTLSGTKVIAETSVTSGASNASGNQCYYRVTSVLIPSGYYVWLFPALSGVLEVGTNPYIDMCQSFKTNLLLEAELNSSVLFTQFKLFMK